MMIMASSFALHTVLEPPNAVLSTNFHKLEEGVGAINKDVK
jgi:hypothetical protein